MPPMISIGSDDDEGFITESDVDAVKDGGINDLMSTQLPRDSALSPSLISPNSGPLLSRSSNGKNWTSEPADDHQSLSSDTQSGIESTQLAINSSPGTPKAGIKRKIFADESDRPASQMADPGAEEIINLSIRGGKKLSYPDVHGFDSIHPKSQYQGWVPPMEVSKEWQVVEEFTQQLHHERAQEKNTAMKTRRKCSSSNAIFDDEEFTEYHLHNFSVYLPGSNSIHPYELASLNNLATKMANSTYRFDGILSNGKTRRYVEDVAFKICSIGGYGEDLHEVGDQIWVQSTQNEKRNIWYRLGQPAEEYARYHVNFIWLANLSKYVIDFAHHEIDEGRVVSIFSFREDFFAYLDATHADSTPFQSWHSQYNDIDFQRAVTANSEFLYKEAVGVDAALEKQPIWREALTEQSAIPEQPLRETQTVVTPIVYECFKNIRFGKWLKAIEPVKEVALRRQSLGDALKLTEGSGERSPNSECASVKLARKLSEHKRNSSASTRTIYNRLQAEDEIDVASIVAGDVLGIATDPKHLSQWEVQDDLWFVYVLRVNIDRRGTRSFNVMWLYKPSDTTCAKMNYPYNNELFMSDHCNCGDPPILEEEVLCKVTVDFGVSPTESKADFFIRHTYLSNEYSFITYKKDHMHCPHQQEQMQGASYGIDEYKVGDTVLILKHSDGDAEEGHLEPREIVEFLDSKDGQSKVRLRKLAFRKKHFPEDDVAPNELVYTDVIYCISAKKIVRKCLIRFYSQEEVQNGLVRTPYDRKGTGDAFYISTRLLETEGKRRLRHIGLDIPKSMKQGFNPRSKASRKLLRGMDLYCGGGNFGRGIEEGGAVHMEWAVDIDSNALHTYHANLRHANDTKLFLGSVDDFLSQAMKGNPQQSELIPLPGDVDFICAGSPCTGYSLLNKFRDNDHGLKNQSLVASVAAYIDFYRPKYALLENVTSMASSGKWQHESALSQLLCAFVGMNYQVQLFTLDAWSFGSPQARTRLFVSLAAPGLELPPHPGLSHSHPPDTRDRGVGTAANGQRFGQRRFGPTTYPYVTADEGTADLPWIGDSRPMACIPFPDHRISIGIPAAMKARLELIPTYPRGLNFRKTWEAGRRDGKIVAPEKVLMSEAETQLFPTFTKPKAKDQMRESMKASSRAYGRVHPDGLFSTITTAYSLQCARSGTVLHWDQQRPLSVMEARRAQSYPDHEALTGTPRKQWKIIGNSVSRAVSLALGLSLREAWLKNPPDEDMPRMMVPASKSSPVFKDVFVDAGKAPASSPKPKVEVRTKTDIEVKAAHYPPVIDISSSSDAESKAISRPRVIEISSSSEIDSDTDNIHIPPFIKTQRSSIASTPPTSSPQSQPDTRPTKRPRTSPILPPPRRSFLTDLARPVRLGGSTNKDGGIEGQRRGGEAVQNSAENHGKTSMEHLVDASDEKGKQVLCKVLVEETPVRGVYIPVDNSEFAAYEATAKELRR